MGTTGFHNTVPFKGTLGFRVPIKGCSNVSFKGCSSSLSAPPFHLDLDKRRVPLKDEGLL